MSHRDAIHTEEYKGMNIYIIPDDDPQSCDPMDWDMLGKQVYWHRRMNLGHCYKETNKYSPVEWLQDKVGDYLNVNSWDVYSKKYANWEMMDFAGLMQKFQEFNLVIPVHAYEHGGITISASGRMAGWDSFDSGQLGFVYVSHEDIKKNYSVKRLTKSVLERAEKCLISEVEEYDNYLTGQVYGYIIEDENDEKLDSCWGFLGDYKYCLSEAKSVVDFLAEKKEEELKLYDERMMK